MSEDVLRKLNPGTHSKPGQELVIANVERKSLPGKISRVEVDAKQQFLKVYGGDNKLVAIYPVTVGSEERPSPKGEFEVTKITEDPSSIMIQRCSCAASCQGEAEDPSRSKQSCRRSLD